MNTLVVRTGLLAGCCRRSPELEAWEPYLRLLPEDTPRPRTTPSLVLPHLLSSTGEPECPKSSSVFLALP